VKFTQLIAVYLTLAFLTVAPFSSAQNNKWGYRIDVHRGLVLPEYSMFLYIANKPTTGLEFSLFKRSTARNYWHQLYRFPEYGITFQFTTLGNDKVFGQEYALYPYFCIPLVQQKSFIFYQQFGLGLGYATKKYDSQTNYLNVAVGSHINVHFNYKLGIKRALSNKTSMNLGIAFTHYSNANMAEPNLGLNVVSLYGGINLGSTMAAPQATAVIPTHIRKNEIALVVSFGGKHTRALQSEIYHTAAVSFEYKHHTFRKLHLGGGLDFSYDSSTELEMKAQNRLQFKPLYNYRSGLHFSQEFVYDRFSFILQEGIYIGLTEPIHHRKMYNKAIVRYKLNSHWLINFAMRSHLHILDYPELAVGFYL